MASLILNAGSSSLKFSIIDHQDGRVHASAGFDASGHTNDAAVQRILAAIGSLEPPPALDGAVHRVVHGGSRTARPTAHRSTRPGHEQRGEPSNDAVKIRAALDQIERPVADEGSHGFVHEDDG